MIKYDACIVAAACRPCLIHSTGQKGYRVALFEKNNTPSIRFVVNHQSWCWNFWKNLACPLRSEITPHHQTGCICS